MTDYGSFVTDLSIVIAVGTALGLVAYLTNGRR